jgi:hypothetical protein
MHKIVLLNVRQLMTDEKIRGNRDYGIILTAARHSKEELDEEPGYFKYKLKIDHIESIMDLKESKPIEFEKGKTPSQKYRWLITDKFGESEYPNYYNWLMSKFDAHSEEYIEQLKN